MVGKDKMSMINIVHLGGREREESLCDKEGLDEVCDVVQY